MRVNIRVALLGLLGLTGSTLGCGPSAEEPRTPYFVVSGRVLNTMGGPVPAAQVVVAIRLPGCSDMLNSQSTVITDGSGRFSANTAAPQSGNGCVSVSVAHGGSTATMEYPGVSFGAGHVTIPDVVIASP